MQSFDKNPSIQAPWWILMIVCVRRRDMMVWSVNALIVVMMDGQCLFEHAWSTQQPSTMDHAGPFLYMISTSSKKILGMSLRISNFLITAFRPSLIFSYMWINPTYMIWICFSAPWSAHWQWQCPEPRFSYFLKSISCHLSVLDPKCVHLISNWISM